MNRKFLYGVGVTSMLLVFCIEGIGSARKKVISSTSHVVIDGRSFDQDVPPPKGVSLLKEELDRQGVSLPKGFGDIEDRNPSNPVFSDRLRDSRSRPASVNRLPAGLTSEHDLRLEGEGRPVDLVFGSMNIPGPSIRTRLISSGWIPVSNGKDPRLAHVLQITRGKETSIVCLDEAEGTFLLFREVGS